MVWIFATALRLALCCFCKLWFVAQEMRELIARCWSPNPEDRPPFTELVKELEGIMAKLPRSTMVRQSVEGGCCAIS